MAERPPIRPRPRSARPAASAWWLVPKSDHAGALSAIDLACGLSARERHSSQENLMDQAATTPIEVWNQIIAPKYIRFRHITVDGSPPTAQRPSPKSGPHPADQALDVACGFGGSTIHMSKIIGPSGRGWELIAANLSPTSRSQRTSPPCMINVSFEKRRRDQASSAYDVCFSRFARCSSRAQSPLCAKFSPPSSRAAGSYGGLAHAGRQ